MRYKVIYFVGKSKRDTIIEATSLDNAQERAEEKGYKWQDIIKCRKRGKQ